MKRNYFTLFMTVAFASMSFAQTNTAVKAKVEDHQFAYNILTNMSYEMGIGNKTTLRFSGPLSGSLLYSKTSITINDYHHEDSEWGYAFRPAVDMQVRHYYNLNKRLQKGKKIAHNSGNYIAGVLGAAGPSILKSDNMYVADFTLTLGAMWGIQRTYGERFMMNVGIGPGVSFYDSQSEFTPVGGITVGFRLGK
ncbi:hypothetical protein BCY89_03365 [Sphingobacterium siyangense]|uniref:DUF3575 domain-containing protein n=1 Tax=Sphingobacterium siyangense TaxID=459529 RepID=A0A420GBH2_9SPHI|nr:hypothetical protein [Sphingobacterium siyangense]RKF42525.1 hypothetical protein BCY89_03365 [Sphingobacterium siyangense]